VNILIVKLSAIGDVIHTLPSLAALRRCYPDADITWVVEEAASDLLTGHPDLDRVLVSRRKAWMRDLRRGRVAAPLREMRAFFRELRSRPYDLVIDFHGLFKSAVIVLLSRGKRKLGYDSMQEGSGLFYNEKIPEVMEKHAVDRYLDFVRYLAGGGIEPSSLAAAPEFKIAPIEEGLRQWTVLQGETVARLENRISDARTGEFSGPLTPAAQRPQKRPFERARGDRDFQGSQNEHSGVIDSAESWGDGTESGGGRKPERPFVAVSPVAFWETKLWEDQKFAELGDRIYRELGIAVILTGGEAGPLERIKSRMKTAAINLGGRTTLRELASLYKEASLVITTDSGPMHLAAAVGTPVVAIFGPTDPSRTGPYGPGHRIIRRGISCSPCFLKHCKDPRCMTEITVEDVFSAVKEVLGK
jgi:3-deoxy-D-manno-octulosonic-acid transferase/heptosyltransferase-1